LIKNDISIFPARQEDKQNHNPLPGSKGIFDKMSEGPYDNNNESENESG